jgi:catechol 2,3-dioxygenase-like lactoylglutathione lyase family enzyme
MKIVHAFDHFVVPVDDLVLAEEFYALVFGAEITRRNGLNVAHRKRGAVPHTFLNIGGKRIGVYLQSEERPRPTGVHGTPTYSFTTTPKGLKDTKEALAQFRIECEGPVQAAHPFATQSLFFHDPAGNYYEVYVPQANESSPGTAGGLMTGVGFLELEAPNLDASVKFYSDVLGFEVVGSGENSRHQAQQVIMRIPSGQALILTAVPFSPKGLVMKRTVPGPHIAFYIAAQDWQAALDHLDRLHIPNGDRGAAKEPRPGRGGTYMDDPGGNVVQFITEGME